MNKTTNTSITSIWSNESFIYYSKKMLSCPNCNNQEAFINDSEQLECAYCAYIEDPSEEELVWMLLDQTEPIE